MIFRKLPDGFIQNNIDLFFKDGELAVKNVTQSGRDVGVYPTKYPHLTYKDLGVGKFKPVSHQLFEEDVVSVEASSVSDAVGRFCLNDYPERCQPKNVFLSGVGGQEGDYWLSTETEGAWLIATFPEPIKLAAIITLRPGGYSTIDGTSPYVTYRYVDVFGSNGELDEGDNEVWVKLGTFDHNSANSSYGSILNTVPVGNRGLFSRYKFVFRTSTTNISVGRIRLLTEIEADWELTDSLTERIPFSHGAKSAPLSAKGIRVSGAGTQQAVGAVGQGFTNQAIGGVTLKPFTSTEGLTTGTVFEFKYGMFVSDSVAFRVPSAPQLTEGQSLQQREITHAKSDTLMCAEILAETQDLFFVITYDYMCGKAYQNSLITVSKDTFKVTSLARGVLSMEFLGKRDGDLLFLMYLTYPYVSGFPSTPQTGTVLLTYDTAGNVWKPFTSLTSNGGDYRYTIASQNFHTIKRFNHDGSLKGFTWAGIDSSNGNVATNGTTPLTLINVTFDSEGSPVVVKTELPHSQDFIGANSSISVLTYSKNDTTLKAVMLSGPLRDIECPVVIYTITLNPDGSYKSHTIDESLTFGSGSTCFYLLDDEYDVIYTLDNSTNKGAPSSRSTLISGQFIDLKTKEIGTFSIPGVANRIVSFMCAHDKLYIGNLNRYDEVEYYELSHEFSTTIKVNLAFDQASYSAGDAANLSVTANMPSKCTVELANCTFSDGSVSKDIVLPTPPLRVTVNNAPSASVTNIRVLE